MKKKIEDLKWRVYHAMWDEKPKVVNVFNLSSRFIEDLQDIQKKMKNYDFEWFKEELNNAARSAYWCKAEYEIGLVDSMCVVNKDNWKSIIAESEPEYRTSIYPDYYVKIDVYSQLKLNWDAFASYTYKELGGILA